MFACVKSAIKRKHCVSNVIDQCAGSKDANCLFSLFIADLLKTLASEGAQGVLAIA